MSYLVLVRHGMSTYNEQGLWTGWDDPSLTDTGKKQAEEIAIKLTDIKFDKSYTSVLKRSIETLDIIKHVLGQDDLPIVENKALNERNYGVYTAKNKWQIKKELGEEEFLKLRRGWDYPIPNGESLKQVYERIVPYYTTYILPDLFSRKNIIIVSSGNALRVLVKYLDKISNDDISNIEIETGEVLVYTIDQNGNIVDKEKRLNSPHHV